MLLNPSQIIHRPICISLFPREPRSCRQAFLYMQSFKFHRITMLWCSSILQSCSRYRGDYCSGRSSFVRMNFSTERGIRVIQHIGNDWVPASVFRATCMCTKKHVKYLLAAPAKNSFSSCYGPALVLSQEASPNITSLSLGIHNVSRKITWHPKRLARDQWAWIFSLERA